MGAKVNRSCKLAIGYDRPDGFVFDTTIGTAMEPGNFMRRECKAALTRAGLPDFRLHDLRHFAVSAPIAEGADIKLLQAIARYASATFTLDTYGHLMTDRISEAARVYDPLSPAARVEGRQEVDAASAVPVGISARAVWLSRRGVAQPG